MNYDKISCTIALTEIIGRSSGTVHMTGGSKPISAHLQILISMCLGQKWGKMGKKYSF